MATSQIPPMISASPYPGLRPFQRYETDIFFGREEQTDKLLEKLQQSHFLAVVGPSGCGKSSLVRAGLIAALETGFLAEAGARWRIAEMRPGDQPLARLANALLEPSALGPEHAGEPDAEAFLHATLRRGPLSLAEVMEEASLPDKVNLLLLVDQFEEIFRFRKEVNSDEADAFVALLLTTAAQRGVPVYVVITMRSDFLGDCALFSGLPEAINESQYLTPRLAREQCQSAILGPSGVFGGSVDSSLVSRLLNDIGPDPDQLPLLQHTLMRMWTRASQSAQEPTHTSARETVHESPNQITLTLDDYLAVGTLTEALSNHADEAFAELDDRQKRIAEVLFRRLTERSVGKRDTRRPARLSEVAGVAGVTCEEVATVVEEFRRSDRSFVTPPPGTPITPETVLDIGHESLISQWHRLDAWVDEEAKSAAIYLRLKQTARLWKAGDAALWGTVDLERAIEWENQQQPTLEWASRYGSDEDFQVTMEFLKASEQQWAVAIQREKDEQEQKQREEVERQSSYERERRLEESAKAAKTFKWLSAALACLLLLMLGTVLYANSQRKQAMDQRVRAVNALAEAEAQREEALKAKEDAENQRVIAEKEAEKAQKATEQAETARLLAEEQKKKTVAAQTRLALLERKRAQQSQQEASEARQIDQLNRQANTKFQADKIAEAVDIYIEVLKSYRRRHDQLGELDTLDVLSIAHKKLGNYDEAESYANQALSIREQSLGIDNPELIPYLTNLASLNKSRGDYGETEKHMKRVVSLEEKKSGLDSIEVAKFLEELVNAYLAQDKYAEAEKSLNRKLSIEKKVLAANDPQIANSLNNLVRVYRALGKNKEADKLQETQGGMTGAEVRELQAKLKELGYDPGVADGVFGERTRKAVMAFQKSKGLFADGIVGPGTLQALNAKAPPDTSPVTGKVTVEIVSKMSPGTPINNIRTNLPFILKALEDQGLADKNMVLMALATLIAENPTFVPSNEFQSRFNTSPGGRPFDLYDNRRDFGNLGPPDGERFKGRGFAQLTGRARYKWVSNALGLGDQLVENPDLANDPDIAAKILTVFLKDKEARIRQALEEGDLRRARRLMTGGSYGLNGFVTAFNIGKSLIP